MYLGLRDPAESKLLSAGAEEPPKVAERWCLPALLLAVARSLVDAAGVPSGIRASAMRRNPVIRALPQVARPQHRRPGAPGVAELPGIRGGPLLPVGCLHGEDDPLLPGSRAMKLLGKSVVARVSEFYVEAYRRLPVDLLPQLVFAMRTAGHCYGLLDPVTNIIFNTVDALSNRPENAVSTYPQMPPRTELALRPEYWASQAQDSLEGLIVFLVTYFKYLTVKQALRYLHLTDFDLLKAMLLIDRERRGRAEPFAHVEMDYSHKSPRLVASLRFACKAAKHPNTPKPMILATKSFTEDQINGVGGCIMGQLTVNDVCGIYDFIRSHVDYNLYPVCESITSLRGAMPLSSLISSFPVLDPTTYPGLRKQKSPSLDTSCEYIRTLRMLLLDTIHLFYMEALARIPRGTLLKQHHAFVMAGHCYGPFDDPVQNILFTSAWYAVAFPCEEIESINSICSHKMRRMESRSLVGLVTYLQARFDSLSEHEALEYLHFCRCNMADVLKMAKAAGHSPSLSKGDFALRKAAKAAKHPRPDHLALFTSLFVAAGSENQWKKIVMSPDGTLSPSAFSDICRLNFAMEAVLPKLDVKLDTSPHVPELEADARETLCLKKEAFLRDQRSIHSMVEYVLHKYKNSLIVSERFDFHIICGASRGYLNSVPFYHVNFIAKKSVSTLPKDSSDINDGEYLECGHTLFFAKIWPHDFKDR
ncbi:hypothetical protein ACP4OV_023164 [Aristida adscensionis]